MVARAGAGTPDAGDQLAVRAASGPGDGRRSRSVPAPSPGAECGLGGDEVGGGVHVGHRGRGGARERQAPGAHPVEDVAEPTLGVGDLLGHPGHRGPVDRVEGVHPAARLGDHRVHRVAGGGGEAREDRRVHPGQVAGERHRPLGGHCREARGERRRRPRPASAITATPRPVRSMVAGATSRTSAKRGAKSRTQAIIGRPATGTWHLSPRPRRLPAPPARTRRVARSSLIAGAARRRPRRRRPWAARCRRRGSACPGRPGRATGPGPS